MLMPYRYCSASNRPRHEEQKRSTKKKHNIIIVRGAGESSDEGDSGWSSNSSYSTSEDEFEENSLLVPPGPSSTALIKKESILADTTNKQRLKQEPRSLIGTDSTQPEHDEAEVASHQEERVEVSSIASNASNRSNQKNIKKALDPPSTREPPPRQQQADPAIRTRANKQSRATVPGTLVMADTFYGMDRKDFLAAGAGDVDEEDLTSEHSSDEESEEQRQQEQQVHQPDVDESDRHQPQASPSSSSASSAQKSPNYNKDVLGKTNAHPESNGFERGKERPSTSTPIRASFTAAGANLVASPALLKKPDHVAAAANSSSFAMAGNSSNSKVITGGAKKSAKAKGDALRSNGSTHTAKSTSSASTHKKAGHKISWKSDPLLSFSDWTIHVIHADTGEVDVYPIHRNLVGFGARKSGYLFDQFQQQVQLRNEQLERHRQQQQQLQHPQQILQAPKQRRFDGNESYERDSSSGEEGTDEDEEDHLDQQQIQQSQSLAPIEYTEEQRWILNSTSRVTVPNGRAASVFPMLLDYMYYTKEVRQTLTAERACHVFLLASQFHIDGLVKAVTDFYQKTLNLNNMGDFLHSAAQARADPLLLVSKNKIGSLITERPELAGLVPPHFFAEILDVSRHHMEQMKSQDPQHYSSQLVTTQSRHWSRAASICVVHHEQQINASMFDQLTHERLLPVVDPSVALNLLHLYSKFHPVDVKQPPRKAGDEKEGEDEPLSSLQQRCIESITNHWQDFQRGFQSSAAVSDALKRLPNHVLAMILMTSMNQKPAAAEGSKGAAGEWGTASTTSSATEATSHGGEED